MSVHPICLVDPSSASVAVLDVAPTGSLWSGTICLDATPPPIRRLFEEFEEIVEGQMFSLADEIEEKIALLALRAVFADGRESSIEDLQVYPSTKRVSFKLRQPSPAAR